ncbi:TniQ family protein [Neptunomonas sp.]|uniref:TniQ family protein n=1 Tax=Neptunomonas sp. TaxID=1971898 RepID=UPI003564FD9C
MIGAIPALLPDELLWSFFSRYKQMYGYQKDSDVFFDFQGKTSPFIHAKVDEYFNNIVARMPKGWISSGKHLVEAHTIAPYFFGCMTEHQRAHLIGSLRLYMTGYKQGQYRDSGMMYCSRCALEDEDNYGCVYWHREHQLPSVFVCRMHHVFLEKVDFKSSAVNLMDPVNTDVIKFEKDIEQANVSHQLLLRIAIDSARLLTLDAGDLELDSIKTSLDKQAMNLGCGGYGEYEGKASHFKISRLIKRSCSVEMLELFGYKGLEVPKASFIATTVRTAYKSPLSLLLTAYALGFSLDDLLAMKEGVPKQLEMLPCALDEGVKLPIEDILYLSVDKPIELPIRLIEKFFSKKYSSV